MPQAFGFRASSKKSQPVTGAPAPAPPSPLRIPPFTRRRVRRIVLAALVAFVLVNGYLATKALYRVWHGWGKQNLDQGNNFIRHEAITAADNAVTAALDAGQALSGTGGAAKHTFKAAKHAARATVSAAELLVSKAAAGLTNITDTALGSNASASGAGEAARHAHAQSRKQLHPLPPPSAFDRSNDSCAQALGIPKIAILFLTYGNLLHEQLWHKWFLSAADMVPVQVTEEAVRKATLQEFQELRVACAPSIADDAIMNPIDQQRLFNVYVHASPSFDGYTPGSLFAGRLISDRVATAWGDMSLVAATRNLLWEAFRDPLNQRFMLVSESDIPLYDPLTMHQQLLAEDKSRVNACRHSSRHEWRWSRSMETEHLKFHHWRKSGQWIGLIRPHVAAVLGDIEIYRTFEQHCFYEWDERKKRARDCFSDEHYVPTLLAVLGLENETECGGWGVAIQDWSKGGSHPREYRAAELTPQLIRQLRNEGQCDSSSTSADAQRRFVNATKAFNVEHQVAKERLRAAAPPSSPHAMQGACPLTARKFPVETAAAALQLFNASCASMGWGKPPQGLVREGESGQHVQDADNCVCLLIAAFCDQLGKSSIQQL